MDAGEIVEQSTPAEFFAGARTERARSFLSKVLAH
jgi:ABC-type polar amino acid transport system ATPase subunit